METRLLNPIFQMNHGNFSTNSGASHAIESCNPRSSPTMGSKGTEFHVVFRSADRHTIIYCLSRFGRQPRCYDTLVPLRGGNGARGGRQELPEAIYLLRMQ